MSSRLGMASNDAKEVNRYLNSSLKHHDTHLAVKHDTEANLHAHTLAHIHAHTHAYVHAYTFTQTS